MCSIFNGEYIYVLIIEGKYMAEKLVQSLAKRGCIFATWCRGGQRQMLGTTSTDAQTPIECGRSRDSG